MPFDLFPKCWRNRDDCEPIKCIDSAPSSTTDKQFQDFDYIPTSFVCSGCVRPEHRGIEQDMYRLCFVNGVIDDMSDNDVHDLTAVMFVASGALALDAIRKVNSGTIEIPTHQSLFDEEE